MQPLMDRLVVIKQWATKPRRSAQDGTRPALD